MLPRDRLERVTRAMNENDVDALLLTPGASMFYLSGFDHGHAAERLLALAWLAGTAIFVLLARRDHRRLAASR